MRAIQHAITALLSVGFALTAQDGGGQARGKATAKAKAPEIPKMIKLTIAAFADGARIPRKYTCAGEGFVSPAMQWSGAAPTTRAYALIMRDPDGFIPVMMNSATADFPHWVIFDIPGNARGLPEGVQHGSELPDGSRQISPPLPPPLTGLFPGLEGEPPPPPPPAGSRSVADPPPGPGYMGPCAPPGHGAHHYVFELYALNAKLGLPATATPQDVVNAMNGKVVGKAFYIGMFGQ